MEKLIRVTLLALLASLLTAFYLSMVQTTAMLHPTLQ